MAGRSSLSSKSPSGPSKADVVALGSSYTPLPSGRSLMKALVVLSVRRMDPVVVLWWSHYRLPWGGSLWHPWSRWGGQPSFGQGAAWSTWMGWPRMPPSSWLSPSASFCGTLPSVRSRVVFLGLLSGPLGRLSRLPPLTCITSLAAWVLPWGSRYSLLCGLEHMPLEQAWMPRFQIAQLRCSLWGWSSFSVVGPHPP